MTPAAKNALVGVALLGGAWGAYRYLYVPWKVKQELLRQASVLAAQRGISQGDALKLLGTVGCQAVAASYGLPPMASGGVCTGIVSLAAQTVAQLPSLLEGTAHGLSLLGAGTGSAISSIGGGTASAFTSLAKAPINVAAYGVSEGYGGVKTAVQDVYGGVKTVVHDLNPLNWF